MNWLLVGFSEEALADRRIEGNKVSVFPCLLPAEPDADSGHSVSVPKAQVQYCCSLLQLSRFAPSLALIPRSIRWLCC